jgi:hypothetical protein
MSDIEKETFEGCCLGERGERRKHKHDHALMKIGK